MTCHHTFNKSFLTQVIIFVFFAVVEGRGLADAKKQIDENYVQVR
jgi:hypothetical protein